MSYRLLGGILRGGVLSLALFSGARPVFAQVSSFAANEVRGASMKDQLRGIKASLRDGGHDARRHSVEITSAFKESADWAPVAEAYYARKDELVARAMALEAELDGVLARNLSERAEDVTKALDAFGNKVGALRSDYGFYMELPKIAGGPRGQSAKAAMRLLAQTGDYLVALAFYLHKIPNRPPFTPLPPGAMALYHR